MHDVIQPEWVWKIRGDPNIIQSPNTRTVRNKELPSLVNEMAHEDTPPPKKTGRNQTLPQLHARLSEAVRDLKKVQRTKPPFRPKRGDVGGSSRIRTLVDERKYGSGAWIASTARYTYELRAMFFQARTTPRVIPAASWETLKKTHSFTARDEGTNPPWGSEFSSAVAARRSPYNRQSGAYRKSPFHKEPRRSCQVIQRQFP